MIRRWFLPAAFALMSVYALWRWGDWFSALILALNVPLNLPRSKQS